MKILIATRHRGIVGGAETYLQAVIPALLKRGHRIAMLYDYSLSEVPKATVDPPGADLPIWYCENLRQRPDQWSELTAWKPDIVYSHDLAAHDVAQALQRDYFTVLYAHAYSGACVTGRKCHSFPQLTTCTRKLGPACLLLHYPRRCGGVNPWVAWKMFREESAHHSLLAGYRAVLVASRHMHAEFVRQGVRPESLHLVRLPLSDPDWPVAPRTKQLEGQLLFLGRLVDVKGVDYLIRAIPRAERKLRHKLTLTVAGDGPELSKLRSLAMSRDIRVEFTGWVQSSQKLDLMRRADLLVVPSLWPEPFGLIGIEAGSVGLPAAGFASGGIQDWLIPGRTGEIASADPPTVEGLGDSIARALQNQDHYDRLCKGAYEFSKDFTLQRHIGELERVLCAQSSPVPASNREAILSQQHAR